MVSRTTPTELILVNHRLNLTLTIVLTTFAIDFAAIVPELQFSEPRGEFFGQSVFSPDYLRTRPYSLK
ncbi:MULTISPECIES: hypothetical protein [Arthrospira]|jgi:hypothetical protein|uniref:hypothetical protein n=1 Tax=Oscillatoriales TaxID=1150 RepID=UPI0001D0F09C|nr:hypothetical protein [Arthrospira platensis]MDF2212833.1 hypothetical protein [Arthrospira platensis NCB002]MDT9310532.1 hypothetical protein [Limnospira sp. Paracas R14]QQW31786.1 hypothetical protein AP9108_15880 [Arthrospira sp. PCC 9108]TVU54883.1 MAG: hypothetical protein EA414_04560 [Arthrospira sp. PLM2.Bin9]BAI91131.1 hypothetical protein NIES39_J00790 [Arthrospira platensis NIES-39]